MEICSALDIVAIAKDAYDRFNAPYRVAERTQYILDRTNKLQREIEILTQPTDPSATDVSKQSEMNSRREPHYLQIINECERELIPSFTKKQGERKSRIFDILTRAKLAVRRDHIGGICEHAEQSQKDHYVDSLLIGASRNMQYMQSLQLHVSIRPCTNLFAAKTLQSCSSIQLDSLQEKLEEFCPIRATNQHSDILPVWGIGPADPELFADQKATQKLSFLVSVAHALMIAHSVKWYHRRLSTENIFVHCDLVSSKDDKPFLDTSEAVKILNFRCPITLGCFDGCTTCQKALSEAIATNDLMTYVTEMQNSLLFSATHDDPYSDGERADVVSFAALTLWTFSGCRLTNRFDILDHSSGEVVSRVPWPLRFIVANRAEISMHEIFVFLQALHERRINPHVIHRPMMSMPLTNGRSSLTSRPEPKLEQILYESSCRSILNGAFTKEPQALFHLGKLQEERAQFSLDCSNQPTSDALSEPHYEPKDTLSRAYACFEDAANLGESSGYLQMAVLLAKCLDGAIPAFLDPGSISHAHMLGLIFKAAVNNNTRAIEILRKVPEVGVQRAQGLFDKPTKTTSDSHNRLFDAVTEIGKCWRRGQAGLSVNHRQAQDWLRVASDRSHPEGTLELGLLMIQSAETHENMREGVKLVTRASNSCPTNAGYSACYWLGYWYHFGLTFKDSELQIVEKDNNRAEMFLKSAAQGAHADGMALYSRLLRIQERKQEEEKWNEEARKQGSIFAFCAYARKKAIQAREVYEKILAGGNDLSNADPTEDLDVDNLNVPKKKKGIGMKFVIRRRTSMTSSHSSGSDVSEHFDPKTKRYKPSAVDKLLTIAVNSLLTAPEKFAETNPEALVIPLPYVMAGRIILRNLDMWGHCAPSVQSQKETKESFMQSKRQEAFNLLRKAAEIDTYEDWRCLRINYKQHDLEDIEKARKYLATYFPGSSLDR